MVTNCRKFHVLLPQELLIKIKTQTTAVKHQLLPQVGSEQAGDRSNAATLVIVGYCPFSKHPTLGAWLLLLLLLLLLVMRLDSICNQDKTFISFLSPADFYQPFETTTHVYSHIPHLNKYKFICSEKIY